MNNDINIKEGIKRELHNYKYLDIFLFITNIFIIAMYLLGLDVNCLSYQSSLLVIVSLLISLIASAKCNKYQYLMLEYENDEIIEPRHHKILHKLWLYLTQTTNIINMVFTLVSLSLMAI